MNRNTGFIVIIAYPDVVVRIANGELISKIWPLFGVGGQNKVKAGHAAMLLVSKETNKIDYFDFGRYITSDKNGRVRSVETDNELLIPFSAKHDSDSIKNLNEILLFLDKHPEKTHGDGRMVVGVNSEVDYDKALRFVKNIQDKGEVSYGAFLKEGSNCARFVTDTLLHATTNKNIVRKLKLTYTITPSPISNVLKGSSLNQDKFQVENQIINLYQNTSLLKEYKQSLFTSVPQEINDIGSIEPDLNSYSSSNGHWLGGIGSGAWFELSKKSENCSLYKIIRRNYKGEIDFESSFVLLEDGFSLDKSFEFQYGSNCKTCIVKQNNKNYIFKIKKLITA